ncbi:DUF1192 family protein [Roseococcus sp. YIM B11640]|uniref:DUF1192 family protein n=1 Tax=Roseococcus sp. YIM B11640 TaxID=3133973 RepID=UPI003C7B0061
MFDEEPRPRASRRLEPAALAEWAENELRAYIEDLKAEIARAEQAIAARSHQRAAADAFFRKVE